MYAMKPVKLPPSEITCTWLPTPKNSTKGFCSKIGQVRWQKTFSFSLSYIGI